MTLVTIVISSQGGRTRFGATHTNTWELRVLRGGWGHYREAVVFQTVLCPAI